MKAYRHFESACAAARGHVETFGGGAAVIETLDLPGMFQVGTMTEAKMVAKNQRVTFSRLFLGISRRRHLNPRKTFPVIEVVSALLHDR